MKLEGKTAIITGTNPSTDPAGGVSGFGKHLTQALLQRDTFVVIADINDQLGQELEQEFNRSYPGKIAYFHCDVTKKSDLQNLFRFTKAKFGTINIVCNNAGIIENTRFESNVQDNWKRVIDIDLTAVILGTRLAIEAFEKDGGGGVILNTASIAGLVPVPLQPVYAAAKSGVVNFSRSLAHLKAKGIRVNAICPSFVKTALTEKAIETGVPIRNWVPIEWVTKAFIMGIEDETLAGDCLRITSQHGIDFPLNSKKPTITPKL
ncbi:hypothetical protein BC833DRAFT_653364 [Globomyces pollinis-pini]|nr:hypothetical protein BC833DRAFT_653364 [Globomyces pollinis-pini]